jgi:hypothetical protein
MDRADIPVEAVRLGPAFEKGPRRACRERPQDQAWRGIEHGAEAQLHRLIQEPLRDRDDPDPPQALEPAEEVELGGGDLSEIVQDHRHLAGFMIQEARQSSTFHGPWDGTMAARFRPVWRPDLQEACAEIAGGAGAVQEDEAPR